MSVEACARAERARAVGYEPEERDALTIKGRFSKAQWKRFVRALLATSPSEGAVVHGDQIELHHAADEIRVLFSPLRWELATLLAGLRAGFCDEVAGDEVERVDVTPQAVSSSVRLASAVMFRVDSASPERVRRAAVRSTRAISRSALAAVGGYLSRLGASPDDAALITYSAAGEAALLYPQRGMRQEPLRWGEHRASDLEAAVALQVHASPVTPDSLELQRVRPLHALELDVFVMDERGVIQISADAASYGARELEQLACELVRRCESAGSTGGGERLESAGRDARYACSDLEAKSRFMSMLFENALAHGDQTLVREGQRTYSWTYTMARALAWCEVLGEPSGDAPAFCAILLPPGVDFVAAALAALLSGRAFIPLSTKLGQARVHTICQAPSVTHVFTTPALAREGGWFDASSKRVLLSTHAPPPRWDSERQGWPRTSRLETRVLYRMFTSGSTGEPKAVDVSFANYLALFDSYAAFLPDFIGLTWAFTGSPVFDSSTKQYLFPLLAGTSLLVPEHSIDSNVVECARELVRQRIDVLNMTPALLRVLVEAHVDISGFRYILTGGEALSVELYERLMEAGGQAVLLNMYGPTEVTVNATGHRGTRGKRYRSGVPIGRTLVHACTMVVDDDLAPVPLGVRGELLLGGALVTDGYPNAPEITRRKFVELSGERWYRSGDTVAHWFDGELFFFGRDDGQVKINGQRVELGEIASRLAKLTDFELVDVAWDRNQLFVFHKVDEVAGCGDYVIRKREEARGLLPDNIPTGSFVPISSVPLTVQGKTDRRALLALAHERERTAAQAQPSSDGGYLQRVIQAALDRERPGRRYDPTQSLWGQGIDSLATMSVLLDIERMTGRAPVADVLYRAPGLKSLARSIERDVSRLVSGWETCHQAEQVYVAFPPVLGNPGIFADLIDACGRDAAWLRCSYPGALRASDRAPSVASLCDRITEELLAGDLRGKRITFVGYSMGCITAYETARRVCAELPLAGLVLIDKGPAHSRTAPTLPEQTQLSVQFLDDSMRARGEVSADLRAQLVDYVVHNTRISFEHTLEPTTRPGFGRVLCVRCTAGAASFETTEWEPFVGRLRSTSCPCTHVEIMQRPWVERIAFAMGGAG
jgi:amino acid adenylation domain-containing protein